MKNLILFNSNIQNDDGEYIRNIIKKDDIKEVVATQTNDGKCYILKNKFEEDMDELNTLLDKFHEENEIYSSIYKFIKELEEDQNIELEECDEYHIFNHNVLVFSFDDYHSTFIMSNEMGTSLLYEHWDGSNHQQIVFDDDSDIEEIEVFEDNFSIDKWDGSDFYTGCIGNHVDIYKTSKGQVLWLNWSQYQGVLNTAEIITQEIFKEKLLELELEPEEFIEKFNAINE